MDDYKPQYATYTAPDFELIPIKDAKWHVHMVYMDGDIWVSKDINLEAEKERLSTVDVYIAATGKDTAFDNYHYYFYKCSTRIINTADTYFRPGHPQISYFALREDTVAQKVYLWNGFYNGVNQESLALDFSTDEDGKTTKPFDRWRELTIKPLDSFITSSGYRLKRWQMNNIYDNRLQYFYKAVGVGGPFAIAPKKYVCPNHNGQTRSVSFVYKTDSIHFEYPLQ